jgi:hypothetical protein
MGKAQPTLLLLGALCAALVTPASAEWTYQNAKSFMADRKGQMHPCCPYIEVALERTETPAVVCPFYANNLKKKNKGYAAVRAFAIGLDTGQPLGSFSAGGNIEDNSWETCALLGQVPEPCMLVFEFSLVRFPKLKQKARKVDGFTVGVVAFPGADEAVVRSSELSMDLPVELPTFRLNPDGDAER